MKLRRSSCAVSESVGGAFEQVGRPCAIPQLHIAIGGPCAPVRLPGTWSVKAQRSNASKRTGALVDAYLELMLGLFALRLPAVQAVLQTQPSNFAINSSLPGLAVLFDGDDMTRAMQSPNAPELRVAVGQTSRIFISGYVGHADVARDLSVSHDRTGDSVLSPRAKCMWSRWSPTMRLVTACRR
jgi:hypothetical protein